MRQFSLSVVLLLCTSALVAACGPTSPTPPISEATHPPESTPTQVRAMVQPTPTTAPAVFPTLPGGCTPPAGWRPYSVQSGDTMYALAQQSGTTPEEIMRANCLASALMQSGQVIYLPLTTCTPTLPEGWITYVVRGGDTLFSLAATRGTTVDEVKRVNCLVSDALRVGQNLYLPLLQQLPSGSPGCTTPDCIGRGVGEVVIVPVPGTTPLALCSPFVCKTQSGVDDMVVLAGAPNDPVNRKPCTPQQGGPWIDAVGHKSEIDPARPRVLELGERSYFFACEFPAGITTAVITMSNGTTQLITLADSVLHPDLDSDSNPFVAWAAKPTHPIGSYELSIVGVPDFPPFAFQVVKPTREHILAVPVAGSPGSNFEMYYVNFPIDSVAQIDLYEEDKPAVLTHTLSFRRNDLIRIDQPFTQPELSSLSNLGWALGTFQTAANYPLAAYGAAYDNRRIFTLFWLR